MDSTSAEAMPIDQPLKRKRGRPAGRTDNHPSAAKSEMEQKMPLVTVNNELSIDVDQQSIVINCDDKDGEEEYVLLNDKEHPIVVDQPPIIYIDDTDDEKENVPLNLVSSLPQIMQPGRVDSEQKRPPIVPRTDNAHNTNTAKNKRVRPAASKFAKSNKEQKKTLLKLKLALIESSGHSSNSSERDNDAHPVPMVRPTVFDVDGQQTCASVQDNCGPAMKSAKEVQVKLPGEHPSFVKRMLQSHVSQGFSLGLPCDFCNKHLPKHDTVIVLEDEDGRSYDTKYLGTKKGLGAGWRNFAVSHGVKVGDVLDFQLVNSTKFKVYISRANNFTTTDGALGLLSLDAGKEVPEEERSDGIKSMEDAKVTTVGSKKTHDDSNDLVSESIIGIRLLDSDINFDDVTCFSNFNIVVDSLVIDCKFTDRLRKMYYELCRAQKSFLHKNLLKKLNLTLAVGVIMETTNIAEGIRACKANASSREEDLVVWKKTLESFEMLGMNVAFLLKCVDGLLSLPDRSRDPAEHKEYQEIKLEQARAEEKMEELGSKMLNVKDTLKKMDVEMEEMESSVRRREEMLQRLATSPW